MKFMVPWSARFVASLAVVGLIASCGLPRGGPNKREIFSGSVLKEGDAFVVSVNRRVTTATAIQPVLGFTSEFRKARQIGSDVIRPGDSLGLTIYENVQDGLLNQGGVGALEEIQVDGAGFIFVPYAGRIRAAGNTPEALRGIITRKLDTQTPDPQVVVRRLAGDGATVSIVGTAGTQGVFPIERPTRTLVSMLARAGGVTTDPQITRITVTRSGKSGTVWLEDLHKHPQLDIALRPSDRILIEKDSRAFTVLGATGAQSRIEFIAPTLSALEVIAQAGGLRQNLADPTGVFVFRNEPEEIANSVLGRNDLQGTQRLVYVLDLTEPNGMFEARDFAIRDDDTVYVTEAPFVQWTKTLQALTGTLTTVNNLQSLGGG